MDLSEFEKNQYASRVAAPVPASNELVQDVPSSVLVESNGQDLNGQDSKNATNIHRLGMEAIYAPIEKQLQSVESILRRELQSETPFVDQLLEHSWLLGGKRLRPVFLLLSAASCGNISETHLQMAAALEMIHTATLVHDDILDNATTRRHRATVNSTWGNKIGVLLGDYLFTHAFHLASRSGAGEALPMLAQASNQVCEGEMLQNQWQGNFELSEPDYMRMITMKTGELCGVGCRIGAFLSDASPQQCLQFEGYGNNLGIAFQIIDDILDLVGEQHNVGKTLGTDLVNQKPTLPVIHSLQHSDPSQQRQLQQILTDSTATRHDVLPFLERTGSIDYARSVARNCARSATDFALSLDQNPNSIALQKMAEFVLQRTY